MSESRPIGSNSNAGFHILGEQSRRFACDRCRMQKLRCLHEDVNSESCERCHRAKANCTHSPLSRIGRPPQADKQKARGGSVADSEGGTGGAAGGARKRQRRRRIPTTVAGTAVVDTLNPADNQDKQWAETANTELDGEGPTSSVLSLRANVATDINTVDTILWPKLRNWQLQSPGTATSNETHTSNTAGIVDSMTDTPFDTDHALTLTSASSDAFDSEKLGFFDDINFFDVGPSLRDPAGASTSMPPGMATQSTPCTPIFMSENNFSLGIGDEVMDLDMDLQHTFSVNTVTNGLHDQRANANVPPPLSPRDPTESAMQQLSDLNLSLFRLSEVLNATRWTNMISSSFVTTATDGSVNPALSSIDTYPIGEVLGSSQKFMDALALFSHSSRNSAPSSPSVSSSEDSENGAEDLICTKNSSLVTRKSGNSTDSSLASYSVRRDGPSLSKSPSRPPHVISRAKGTAGSRSFQEPDTPTTIVIIACYLRLLRIYSTLFSHINLSLRASPEKQSEFPPAMPGLHLSGFQLPSSGNLQTMILVQVCVHMLGRIERTLGIPEDRTHRSRRKSSDTRTASGGRMGNFSNGNERASSFRRKNGGESYSFDLETERGGHSGAFPGQLVSVELLEMAIKQEDLESQRNDRRGLSSLRDDIKKVKQLLKRSMAL